eukprot:GEMP01003267.1.p1 GENE.GEMP01003267.1~~GEMP01003267.1.p1  ORF type:complete len:1186 (+),score=210.05 GEMP01003267.1:306-3863(+)
MTARFTQSMSETDLASTPPKSPGADAIFAEFSNLVDEDNKAAVKSDATEKVIGIPIEQEEWSIIHSEFAVQKYCLEWGKFDMFFGVLIIVYCVVLGIETDVRRNEDFNLKWYLIGNAFQIIFMLELGIRMQRLGPCFALKTDSWIIFDTIILSVNAADLWLVQSELITGQMSGSAVITLLRVLRLVRLTRLVRVLKLLEPLWVLIECILVSIRTITWALLLLVLVCYIWSVFTMIFLGVNDVHKDGEVVDPPIPGYGSIYEITWIYVQLFTLNGWPELTAPVVKRNGAFWIVFGTFMIVASLGVGNLLIGVIVETTLNATQEMARRKQMQKKLQHNVVLLELRQLLRNYNSRPTLRDPLTISGKELLDAYETPGIKEKFEVLGVTVRELCELLRVLSAPCTVSTRIDDDEELISLDILLSCISWMRQSLRPVDTLSLQVCLKNLSEKAIQVEARSVRAMAHLREALLLIHEAAKNLLPRTAGKGTEERKYSSNLSNDDMNALREEKDKQLLSTQPAWILVESLMDANKMHLEKLIEKKNLQREKSASSAPGNLRRGATLMKQRKFNLNKRQATLNILDAGAPVTEDIAAEVRIWGFFDSFYGIIVIINSVLLGFQTDYTTPGQMDYNWYLVDNIFIVIFMLELVSRYFIFTQMRFGYGYDLRLKLFPTSWHKGQWGTLKAFAQADPYVFLDILIILMAMMTQWVLIWDVRNNGQNGEYKTMAVASILRTVRIFRLTRVFRLVPFLRELWLVCTAFVGIVGSLMWTVVIIFLSVFIYAVAGVMMFKTATDLPAEYRAKYWGDLGPAFYSMFRIVTLDQWSWVFRDALLGDFTSSILGALLMITSIILLPIAVMNMIVGVLVELADELIMTDSDVAKKQEAEREQTLLEELAEKFQLRHDAFGTPWIDRLTLEAATHDPELTDIFRELGLPIAQYHILIDKLDFEGKHEMALDDFVEGIHSLKKTSAKGIDVMSITALCHQLCRFGVSVRAMIPCMINEITQKLTRARVDVALIGQALKPPSTDAGNPMGAWQLRKRKSKRASSSEAILDDFSKERKVRRAIKTCRTMRGRSTDEDEHVVGLGRSFGGAPSLMDRSVGRRAVGEITLEETWTLRDWDVNSAKRMHTKLEEALKERKHLRFAKQNLVDHLDRMTGQKTANSNDNDNDLVDDAMKKVMQLYTDIGKRQK